MDEAGARSGVPPASADASRPDVGRLAEWLRPHLPELRGAMTLDRIHGGQSNPSWVVRSASGRWVLRARPAPAATLAPSAHAIEREFCVLHVLLGSGVPVPRPRVLCDDESVIGAAFYVMDHVDGRVFRDAALPTLPPSERAAFHWEANRVLAELHRIDWQALGLQGFGRSQGFFERTVRRCTEQYLASEPGTGPIEAMRQLADWLPQHIPPGADDAACVRLTHGDFRIENLMFDACRSEIVAVLDWELATLGHPLSDLAYNCTAWHLPAGPLQGFGGGDPRTLGLPDERAYVEEYCRRTGDDIQGVMAHWPFYLACNLFRLGAILAGIGVRVRDGTASHPKAAEIACLAEPVARLGWQIATGRVAAWR